MALVGTYDGLVRVGSNGLVKTGCCCGIKCGSFDPSQYDLRVTFSGGTWLTECDSCTELHSTFLLSWLPGGLGIGLDSWVYESDTYINHASCGGASHGKYLQIAFMYRCNGDAIELSGALALRGPSSVFRSCFFLGNATHNSNSNGQVCAWFYKLAGFTAPTSPVITEGATFASMTLSNVSDTASSSNSLCKCYMTSGSNIITADFALVAA